MPIGTNQYLLQEKMEEQKKIHAVTIATKINGNSYAILKTIADNSGLKVYKLLQTIVDAYLRYLAKEQIITDNLEKVIKGFANFQLTKDSFAYCSTNTKREIKSCIAFIEANGKPQPRPVLIHTKKDKNGNVSVFESIADDAILRAFLLAFAPELIPELREIKEANELLSMADALKFAVHEQTAPTQYDITADIESLFADNDRTEDGKKIDFDGTVGKYVRHRFNSMACMEKV